MANNVGYLTSSKTPEHQEMYTPYYAVDPIVKYIPKHYKIWCPFDDSESEYVKILKREGYEVINSHIDEGKNFFEYEPEEYDCIISNPPFSIKDDILKRLDELNKPYAILLPLPTLQGQKRFASLKNCQALIFDKRINFYKDRETKEIQKGVAFASIYICKNFLEKDLIFEEI